MLSIFKPHMPYLHFHFTITTGVELYKKLTTVMYFQYFNFFPPIFIEYYTLVVRL